MSRFLKDRYPATAVLISLATASLCLASCALLGQAPAGTSLNARDIKTLLVMPFDTVSERHDVGSSFRCPVCGAVFSIGSISSGAESFMTKQLLTFLKVETPYELIPPGQGQGVRSKILSESAGLPERDLLLQIGRKLNADAVIKGTVYRFRERVGTRFSVDTPASVAFDIHLIRVENGRVMWQGHSDITQQSLSENLFKIASFIRDGGRWLTSEELAGSELNRVMAKLPLP